MPKVSIIVPVYNAQQWLVPCVDSVIAQTVSDWQLILVDDGSTDNSGQLCDDYAASDSRIHSIHKQNGGLSSARNIGIDHADGEYIYFLDADDEIHPQTLEFLENMQRESGADICVGGAIYATDYEFKILDFKDYKTYKPKDIIAAILYQNRGFLNTAWNTLYAAHLFDGLRFREGLWYEDLDFFYRMYAGATMVSRSNQITYLYRKNESSFMNTWSHSRLDVLRVVDNMVKHMEQYESTALQQAAADRRFSAYFNIFVLAAQHGEHAICDRCWSVICEQRATELTNKEVRLKNKLGALISYLGKPATKAVARLISKL